MQVSVKLFGGLRQYLPAGSAFNTCVLVMPDECMLMNVLSQLPIPENKTYIVLLNDVKLDRQAYADTRVSASDQIVLLPPIKGG